jgi:putative ABC transport system permease protein
MQTLMSLLGLVIGVAALVGVLSLGDGMEAFGRQQLETTTSVQGMVVRAQTTRMVDGVTLRREAPAKLDLDAADALAALLGDSARVLLLRSAAAEIGTPTNDRVSAARVQAVSTILTEQSPYELAAGRWLTDGEIRDTAAVAVVATSVLSRLFDEPAPGVRIRIGDRILEVVGIYDSDLPAMSGVVVPASLADIASEGSTVLQLRATRVEDIPAIKERILDWGASRFGGDREALAVETSEMRVEQVRRGILLFKLIMGLITGISVLVGLGGIFAVTPIIKAITEVPFQAGFSWSTIGIVAIVGAAVGIVFGTYPAFRAARLNPVDAMRYE